MRSIALFRTLGLNVFQSAFAQGLTSDPLDKTISYTIVYAILIALPITVRTMFSRGEARRGAGGRAGGLGPQPRVQARNAAGCRRPPATTGPDRAGCIGDTR